MIPVCVCAPPGGGGPRYLFIIIIIVLYITYCSNTVLCDSIPDSVLCCGNQPPMTCGHTCHYYYYCVCVCCSYYTHFILFIYYCTCVHRARTQVGLHPSPTHFGVLPTVPAHPSSSFLPTPTPASPPPSAPSAPPSFFCPSPSPSPSLPPPPVHTPSPHTFPSFLLPDSPPLIPPHSTWDSGSTLPRSAYTFLILDLRDYPFPATHPPFHPPTHLPFPPFRFYHLPHPCHTATRYRPHHPPTYPPPVPPVLLHFTTP